MLFTAIINMRSSVNYFEEPRRCFENRFAEPPAPLNDASFHIVIKLFLSDWMLKSLFVQLMTRFRFVLER